MYGATDVTLSVPQTNMTKTRPCFLALLHMQSGAHDLNRVCCMTSYRTKHPTERADGGDCLSLPLGSHEVSILFATPCPVV